MNALLEGVSGELRTLEFKESFKWVIPENAMTEIQAKTLKTLLAFCNTPQGGALIVGVTDNGASQHNLTGVGDEEKATFQDTEAIARQIDSFSSSAFDYDIGIGAFDSKEYIVFTVSEFRSVPVQCAKDLVLYGTKQMLQKHAIYTRSGKSQPETIMATPLEVREIITMAEERDEQFINKFRPTTPSEPVQTDIERYDALDRDLL